jgi:heme/copper-type cytochrome/quinol oxidase subunit 2
MPFSIADAIYWTAVACCAIAQLAILRSVLVSPARVGEPAATSMAHRVIEVAWAVLPGIALAVVFALTWKAMHASSAVAATAAAMLP